MREPVTLQSSRMNIDRSTFHMRLLLNPTDPMNGQPLRAGDAVENSTLQSRIQEFTKAVWASESDENPAPDAVPLNFPDVLNFEPRDAQVL